MDLYPAMSTLRAVRRLRPDPVPPDVLERVLRAATWAPTGGNRQPWRVVVVRERALMGELAALYAARWRAYADAARRGLDALPEGPAADDARTRARRMLDAGDHLAAHFAATPVLFVFAYDPGRLAVTDAGQGRLSVVGGASVYPAVQNLLLACRNEGLGCVLTTLLCQDEERVRELLAIPDPWHTAAAIPAGYPLRGGHGPLSRRPVSKMAFADRWGEAWAHA